MKIENSSPCPAVALPGFGPQDRAIVTIVVKGTFDLVPGTARLAATQVPIAFADEIVETPRGPLPRLDSDVAPFKPNADVILIGRASAPGGKPAPHVDVRFRVGRHSKTLRVFGARTWEPGGFGREPKISAAKPFRECPLDWTLAYGGASMENPLGIGWIHENPKIRKKDIEGQPLPRIEDPTDLIEDWEHRPAPAGFGTIGRGWQPRLALLGTYDEPWKKERSPLPPRDFDFAFHNAAPADQQIEGGLKGGESFAIVNATDDGRLAGTLPEERPLVMLKRTGGATHEEVAMKLDTAIFEPDAKKLTLLWRGTPAIPAMERNDVAEIRVSLKDV